jgi:tRNA nucleotidyltransferase (CCA-adding enzyme)
MFPGRVNAVGRAFGILKINVGDGVEFDVSIPRRESKIGKGHRGFAVMGDPGMTIEDAARRRDFTMNSLAADPLTGELLDPFDGQRDIQGRMLRVTDPERFQDDPLRVYRALQFAARLELKIDPESERLMREMVSRGDLEELAKERVTDELKKLMIKATQPSIGWQLARRLGIIEKYFPELQALIGLEQEPEWHPEGDVWTHTMLVLDAAGGLVRKLEYGLDEQGRLQVMLGCLCHDLGKATTTAVKDGRIRSHGHEEAGEKPTRDFCDKLAFGDDTVEAAVKIAAEHMKPSQLTQEFVKSIIDETQFANAVRKLIKRLSPVSWRVLLAAAEADWRGRAITEAAKEKFAPYAAFEYIVKKYQLDDEPARPLVQGRDLLLLGVKPGPRMGEIIKEIEGLRDAGKILNKKDALDHAREMLERP